MAHFFFSYLNQKKLKKASSFFFKPFFVSSKNISFGKSRNSLFESASFLQPRSDSSRYFLESTSVVRTLLTSKRISDMVFDEKPSTKKQKILQLAISRGLIIGLNGAQQLAKNPRFIDGLETSEIFHFAFSWLYDIYLGDYTKAKLCHFLKNKEIRLHYFKNFFLNFQKRYTFYFNYNEPITRFSNYTVRVFFSQKNLVRIIVVLLRLYNINFLKQLSLKEKKDFIKYLVSNTINIANYSLINKLLNPIACDGKIVYAEEKVLMILK